MHGLWRLCPRVSHGRRAVLIEQDPKMDNILVEVFDIPAASNCFSGG